MVFIFSATQRYYGVHPLQVGLLRRKRRRDRRHGLARESALRFYPRRLGEMAGSLAGFSSLWSLWRLRRHVEREALAARPYRDLAIAPVEEDRDEGLELYQATEASRAAVARVRARAPRSVTLPA
jgi:hypothetical protein